MSCFGSRSWPSCWEAMLFNAGDVITTGPFAGVLEMQRGQRAPLVFEAIGEVALSLD